MLSLWYLCCLLLECFAFFLAFMFQYQNFCFSLWYLCCGLLNTPEDVLTCSDLNNFVVLTFLLINYSNIYLCFGWFYLPPMPCPIGLKTQNQIPLLFIIEKSSLRTNQENVILYIDPTRNPTVQKLIHTCVAQNLEEIPILSNRQG